MTQMLKKNGPSGDPDLIVLKRGVSLSPKSGIRTIFIDEMSDLGSGDKWYLTVASSTSEPFEFGYIIGKKFKPYEVKAKNNKKNAYKIIRELNPVLDRTYFIATHKRERLSSEEQHALVANTLYELASMILEVEDADYLEVYVDNTTQIQPQAVQNIFNAVDPKEDRTIYTTMRHSHSDVGLQSHDFITRAYGREYNNDDRSYRDVINAEEFGREYQDVDELKNARLPISAFRPQAEAFGQSKDRTPEYKRALKGRQVANPKSSRKKEEHLKWEKTGRERYQCGSLKITKSSNGKWILFDRGKKRKEFGSLAEAKAFVEASIR